MIKCWVRCACRNLLRNRHRTLLNLLAIAAAVASLILFSSFVDGVKAHFRMNIVRMKTGQNQIAMEGHKPKSAEDPFSFPITNADEIRARIEKEVGPLAYFSGKQEFYGLLNFNDRSMSAVGMGVNAAEDAKFLTLTKTISGTALAEASEDSIALGAGLAESLGLKTGDNMSLLVSTAQGSINAADVQVAGIFRTGTREIDNSLFYIHFSLAQKLLRIKGPAEIGIAFTNENELIYLDPLRNLLKKEFPQMKLYHWHDIYGDLFDNSIGWLNGIFRVFKVIILIIAVLSITNLLTMSVLERLGEFGTLRALGTTRNELIRMVLGESFLQSLIGSVAGVGFAAIIILFCVPQGITMPPPPNMTTDFNVTLRIPWDILPWAVALGTIVTALSGLLPALKASHTNIVLALGKNI